MPSLSNPFRIAIFVPLAVVLTLTCKALGLWSPLIIVLVDLLHLALQNISTPFILLATFRYLRIIAHFLASLLLYRVVPVQQNPTYTGPQCTVIIPDVDAVSKAYLPCLESCLSSGINFVILTVTDEDSVDACERDVEIYASNFQNSWIEVVCCPEANRRLQLATAISHVETEMMILVEDNVIWPSNNFLPVMLAPFEDMEVGAVGTCQNIRSTDTGLSMKSFQNMIEVLHLQRQKFEVCATNLIDGCASGIPYGTSIYRTQILQDPAFTDAFVNQTSFFGRSGPLVVDELNYITRWLVNHGWDVKIQYNGDAHIETSAIVSPSLANLARSKWRNYCATVLANSTVWRRQPWCVYAVYLTYMIDLPLIYDAALIYSFTFTPIGSFRSCLCLGCIILLIEILKLVPYLTLHLKSVIWLPAYLIFYCGSGVGRLYTGITFWRHRDSVIPFKDPLSFAPVTRANTFTVPSVSPPSASSSQPPQTPSASYSARSSSSIPATASTGHGPFASGNNENRRSEGEATRHSYRPTSRATHYGTPWGPVSPANPHTKPANILEGNLASSAPAVNSRGPSRRNSGSSRSVRSSHDYDILNNETWMDTFPDADVPIPSIESDDLHVALQSAGRWVYQSLSPSPPSQRYPPVTAIVQDRPHFSSSPALNPNQNPSPSRSPSISRVQHFSPPPAPVPVPVPAPTSIPVTLPPAPPSPISVSSSSSPPSSASTDLVSDRPHFSSSPSPRLGSTNATASTYTNYLRPRNSTMSVSTSTQPIYNRIWVRGSKCSRLHYDNCMFASANGGCKVEDVFDLPVTVVRGRPRF